MLAYHSFPSNDQLVIGAVMPDGTIYAGISPNTQKPFYCLPIDGPEPMTWTKAGVYTKALDAHGHQDWRLPTREELLTMHLFKDQIGNFVTEYKSGSATAHWYWACTEYRDDPSLVWNVRFSDGVVLANFKDVCELSVRPVRAEPVDHSVI